jgi:hypothetical protein
MRVAMIASTEIAVYPLRQDRLGLAVKKGARGIEEMRKRGKHGD